MPLGHNRTNGAAYSKANFKVEICSALKLFDSHPTIHSPLLNPNKHYNHGFHNTFDYNHFIYSDYLLGVTISRSTLYVLKQSFLEILLFWHKEWIFSIKNKY